MLNNNSKKIFLSFKHYILRYYKKVYNTYKLCINFDFQDLCLSAVEPGVSNINVKGVVRVELDILDRVEMGKQLQGVVRLYSANNKVSNRCLRQ